MIVLINILIDMHYQKWKFLLWTGGNTSAAAFLYKSTLLLSMSICNWIVGWQSIKILQFLSIYYLFKALYWIFIIESMPLVLQVSLLRLQDLVSKLYPLSLSHYSYFHRWKWDNRWARRWVVEQVEAENSSVYQTKPCWICEF